MRVKIGNSSHYESQGTDIYIKKIDEGAGYGAGYIVEVYEYGQKVSEDKVPTKKKVKEIIDQQKDKYKTDRAFEEESHLFVSYRIDDIESKKFRDKNHINVNKGANMDYDSKLYKQASRINFLLQATKDPEVPVKVFRKADALFNFDEPTSTPDLPIDPSAQGEETTASNNKDSVEDIAQQIAEKIDVFLMGNVSLPRDDIHNEMQTYLAKKIKPLLPQSGYSKEEIEQIGYILANRYKNSEIPNADVFSYNKSASIISKDIIGSTPQTPLTNMNSINQANTMSPIAAPDGLSLEAQNMISMVNIDKDDPFKAYDKIKSFPNSEAIIEEIKTKGNNTEAENAIVNYKSAYLNGLCKFADDEFNQFHKHLKTLKGVNSFNKSFSKWASLKKYTQIERTALELNKKAFVQLAKEKPLDNKLSSYKKAAHKFALRNTLRIAELANSPIESSDELGAILEQLYFLTPEKLFPKNDPQTIEKLSNTDPASYATELINSISGDQYTNSQKEVISNFFKDMMEHSFDQQWASVPKVNRTRGTFKNIFSQIWKNTNYQEVANQIAESFNSGLQEWLQEASARYPERSAIYEALTVQLSKYWGASLSRFLNPTNTMFSNLIGGIINSANAEWLSKYFKVAYSLIQPKKYAVTIIVNESADGSTETQIVEDPSLPDTFGNSLNTPLDSPATNDNQSTDLLNSYSGGEANQASPLDSTSEIAPQGTSNAAEDSMFNLIQDM